MLNKSKFRFILWIAPLVIVPILIGLGYMGWKAFRPKLTEAFSPSSQHTQTALSPTATPTSTDTHSTGTTPIPKPSPTLSPVLSPTPTVHTLIWSKEASAVYLRVEPGGTASGLLENGSPVQVSEVQPVDEMDWAQVRFFDGSKNIEGWVAAPLVVTIRGDLPVTLVSGENGVNLRVDPGGTWTAWLPHGTPVQIIETADVDGVTWAHVILPDERGGWIAQRLLNTIEP